MKKKKLKINQLIKRELFLIKFNNVYYSKNIELMKYN